MRFVIVTGVSGGGKSTAMKMLEDMGYYCVDNMPVSLLDKFIELIAVQNRELTKVALGIHARPDQDFKEAEAALTKLSESGFRYEILFMDASAETLVRRYKESRRVHPMATVAGERVADSIQKEREILKGIRTRADYVIDSSRLLTRVLKEELNKIFVENDDYNSLMVNVMSFGFKHGIPSDVDLVFDVRFLPNPFYIDELKPLTGNDTPVHDYVMKFPEAGEFLKKLVDMVEFLIPNYVKEGKNQLVIGVGCTGGKHRSVTLANELYNHLKGKGSYGLTLTHRDAEK